jgi:hypothetical protein
MQRLRRQKKGRCNLFVAFVFYPKKQPEKAAQKLRAFPYYNLHRDPRSAAGTDFCLTKPRFGGTVELRAAHGIPRMPLCIINSRTVICGNPFLFALQIWE